MTDSPHRATFAAYQAAWLGGLDRDERRRRLDACVAPTCVYQDPGIEAHGHDALLDKIEDANRKGPGATFRNDSFLTHHDKAVVNWTMFDGAGEEFAQGASFVTFGPDGRLTTMTGFYDPPTRPFGTR